MDNISCIMKQTDYEIAKELKERLSEFVSIIDFKVFGSRARGDADEYSDMDVFIEVESINKELKTESTKLHGKWVLKTSWSSHS